MSRNSSVLAACLLGLVLASATPSPARAPKKYQVAGKVLEVTDDFIAVDKNGERWEVGRTTDTKVIGSLKVGATVTVEYTMSARTVDVKDKK
jgi:hypothetical protein